MKRILALAVVLVMLAGVFSGCSLYYKLFGYDNEYTGEIYNMYFGEMPTSLDPKDAYIDDSTLAVMSMIYAGLYKYEEDGSVTEDLAEEFKELSFDDQTGELEIEISIRNTRWSDEISVQADQFIYAWRRLLEPTASSSAAALLYDIKNAREIKTAEGKSTKYDLAVYAVDTRVLHVTLQGQKKSDGSYAKPDVDLFKAKLASPLLVPVRSDKVSKLTYWATSNETVPSCGPFYLRTYNQQDNTRTRKGAEIILQRNKYYLRDEEYDPIDKYVKPYQLVLNYSIGKYIPASEADNTTTLGTAVFDASDEQALYYYRNGKMDYLSYVPLEERANYASQATVRTMPFTHAYLFNTEHPLLRQTAVRQALSMAIDRTALANKLVFAKAAVSIVSPVVTEKGETGDAFIDHLTNGVKDYGQLSEAKKMLSDAGIVPGDWSFTIAVKPGDAEAVATAKYCIEVWGAEGLGFNVTLYPTNKLRVQPFTTDNDYDCKYDAYYECYKAGGASFNANTPSDTREDIEPGFDVIAIDVFSASTDAFTTLAPYSKYFSGMALDMTQETTDFEPALPLGGYDSTRYNYAVKSAFESAGLQTRANYLHAAEEQLMRDMPIMPLFYHQYSVMVSDGIENVSYGYGGAPRFTETEHKNYDSNFDISQLRAEVIEMRRKELGLPD